MDDFKVVVKSFGQELHSKRSAIDSETLSGFTFPDEEGTRKNPHGENSHIHQHNQKDSRPRLDMEE